MESLCALFGSNTYKTSTLVSLLSSPYTDMPDGPFIFSWAAIDDHPSPTYPDFRSERSSSFLHSSHVFGFSPLLHEFHGHFFAVVRSMMSHSLSFLWLDFHRFRLDLHVHFI